MRPILRCALVLSLLALVSAVDTHLRRQLSDTDGYDVGGKAPICWATTKPGTKNATVSRMSSCPTDVTVTFTQAPPTKMFAGQHYHTIYRFNINPTAVSHYQYTIAGKKWDVPHANIHSCYATVGFCTPFIGNTPGLATHTPALKGNILATGTGNIYSVDFDSDVVLNPGSYTIIAHIRYYSSNGTVQYDIANAIFRDVLPFVKILEVKPAIKYVMYAVIGMGALFLITILGLLVYYRKNKVLKASQVNILVAMDVVGLMSVCALPLYAWPTTLSCNLQPWLVIVPLNLMFGLLFGKTWRIWRLMNNKGFKALRITEYQVLLIALALCFVEIAARGLEAIVAPITIGLKPTVNSSTLIHYCKGNGRGIVKAIHLTYAAAILVMGCIAANESSKLTTLFNEGKYIVFSIYTCAILSVIIVPASFAVSGDPTVGFILTIMGIVMSVCGTIGAINVPKFLVIRSGVEISINDNANKTGGNKTMASPNGTSRPPPTTPGSPTHAPKPAGPPGSQTIGRSIPSALLKAMKTAVEAINKVVTRQDQGFAVIPADFEACTCDVDHLNMLFAAYRPAPVPGATTTTPTAAAAAGGGGGGAGGGGEAPMVVLASTTTPLHLTASHVSLAEALSGSEPPPSPARPFATSVKISPDA